MTDLSKIDFSRLTLPEWSGDSFRAVMIALDADGYLRLHRGAPGAFATLSPRNMVWFYANATWTDLEVAKTYTDRVDRFIAEESARIAREEEAVNFVPVPWQDVAWLSNGGASVQYLDDEIRKWVEFPCQFNASGRSRCSYRADRRTFPAGYDPTKPRWVTVSTIDDLDRLRAAGATARAVEVSLGYLCQVDIHTLKPGVPLHVEPPKPEPRPCTREFALSHPGESEVRVRQHDGHRLSWSTWQPMSRAPLFQASVDDYKFRTTASEPERRQVTVDFDGKRWAGELVEQ